MPRPKGWTKAETKRRDSLAKWLAKKAAVENPYALATYIVGKERKKKGRRKHGRKKNK